MKFQFSEKPPNKIGGFFIGPRLARLLTIPQNTTHVILSFGSDKKSLLLCDQDRSATTDHKRHPRIPDPPENIVADHANAWRRRRRSDPDHSLPR